MISRYVTSSRIRRVAGAGLVIAAVGIPIQIAGGADYPTVPPRLLILLTAAALVLFAPWRWALGLTALATLFISVGTVVAPSFRHQLGDPVHAAVFIGSVVQVVGLVFGAAAIVAAFRGSGKGRGRDAEPSAARVTAAR